MKTAKLFRNGQSQAVRLPKEFRLPGGEVFVQRMGRCVVLVPKDKPWDGLFEAAAMFTDDFMAGRDQGTQGPREGLD